jgi:hypothetical protein
MIAFFIGTFFGFTVAAIFSTRAYDKGYKDAKHVHCFCDKKYDITDDKGQKIIVMACNKCGLEETHVLEEAK